MNNENLHKQIAKGLGHNDVSPATLAYKMLRESEFVNISLMQYLVNYVHIMANTPIVPFHLQGVQGECKEIALALEELGYIGKVGREQIDNTDYLAV